MNDLSPFVKLCWNSIEHKNKYSRVAERTRKATHALEYEMVRRGLRKVNVYHMNPSTFDVEVEKLSRDGLSFLPIVRSKNYNGYSHRHYPTDHIDMDTFVYGVVSKNLADAEAFLEASKRGDHKTQGLLLGYPECCTEAFTKWWTTLKVLDPCFESALATEGAVVEGDAASVQADFRVNPSLRYFGFKVSPFFPCSLQCGEAVKVGEAWFNVLKELDGEAAGFVRQVLECEYTWSLRKGIIYVVHPYFRGVVNGYPTSQDKVLNVNSQSREAFYTDLVQAVKQQSVKAESEC